MGSTEMCEVSVQAQLSLRNWTFPSEWSEKKRKCPSYTRFFDPPLMSEENECDIRNQHQKLHRRILHSQEKSFRRNPTCTPPQLFFTRFSPVVLHGSNFCENFLFSDSMFADVVFGADSDYGVHFPWTRMADRKNGCMRGIFSSLLTMTMENFNFSVTDDYGHKPRTSLYSPSVAS